MTMKTKSKPKPKSKRPAATKPASPPAAKPNGAVPAKSVNEIKLRAPRLMAAIKKSTLPKAEIIRQALAKGINSPTAISAYAKSEHGLSLDPKYVSVIKSQINARERGRTGRGNGRDMTKDAATFALKCGGIDKAKKALETLNGDPVMGFAIVMGGVDRAVKALDELNVSLAGE